MNLPERTLGEVLQSVSTAVSVDPEGEYPIAGIYSFGRGLIRRPTICGSDTSYATLSRLRVGQLTMSKLNAWEGALVVVPEEFEGSYVSPEYPVFKIDTSQADPAYIAHLARWPGLWDRLTPRGSMVRRKRTTPTTLLATKAPLPGLDEQRRIAARLDSVFIRLRRTDELRERRERLRTSLTESAISAAISKSTAPISLGSLMSASRTPVEIIPGNEYRALGMRSFGKGFIHYEPVPGRELSKLRYYKFPAHALALSNIKAWEGAIGVTTDKDTPCVASNRFLFYSAKNDKINVSYIRHYLLSREGIAKIGSASPGSADRNRTLSIQGFEAIEIPLPPLEIQDDTARLIDSVTIRLGAGESITQWETLKLSLLNAAFNGQL
jgi:type I restriction enzyme, S subunit